MDFSEIKKQAKDILEYVEDLKKIHGFHSYEVAELLGFENPPSFTMFKKRYLKGIEDWESKEENSLDIELGKVAKDNGYTLTHTIYKEFGEFIKILKDKISDFEKDTNEIVKDLKGFDLWKDFKANLFINFIKATPNELPDIEGVYFIYRNADRFNKKNNMLNLNSSRVQKLPLRIQKNTDHNILEAQLKVIRLAPDNSSFAESLYSGVIYLLES